MSGSIENLTTFTTGDLVLSVYGDGAGGGTYTDNQAAPIVLDEITTSGSLVGTLELPQTTTIANGTTEYAISGEYGSSSEGSLQLSANGQDLLIAGYGVNAVTYNTGGAAVYGNAALAQSTSVPNGQFTAVARVIASISASATIDTSTAVYNVDNGNNPRSVASLNGTTFYLSGQGMSGETPPTQGVFEVQDGANSGTPIDTSTDTRTAEIINGMLYVSRDSKQGTGGTSDIAQYGTVLPTGSTTPTVLGGIDGTVTLTAAEANTVNMGDVGTVVHLSPENFFFASPDVLYVADGGNPKEGGLGDGGLQKWVLTDGTWDLEYTLSQGLSLVADSATSGTTGLIGLTGTVVDGVAELYATNSTIGDLDQTYLYGISDTLDATSNMSSFVELVSAAPDTNIRGISFAPEAAMVTTSSVVAGPGTPQSAFTISAGSTLTVLSGGTASSGTILGGGTVVVSSGGTELGDTLAHGGAETVLGGASFDLIDGVQLVSAATATVTDETVFNGGTVELFLKGAVATGVTLTNGGVLAISGNAVTSNTVISGGGLIDLESAKAVLSGALTFSGAGTLEVAATASAGYGDAAVISGFGAGDIIDLPTVASGATLTTALVSGNTVATVSGGTTQSFTFAGDVGSSLQLVADGGTGVEITTSATTTSGTSGGSSTMSAVISGQTLPNATVSAGEVLTVMSGGTLVSADVLSGGSVVNSGFDSGSTLQSGGFELVITSAVGDQISGVQLISAGGAVVTGETVFNGGSIDLFLKGGTVANAVVLSGGQLNINGNATALDTVLSAGAVLDLQSPKANFTGTLSFAGPALFEETDIVSSGFGDLGVIAGFVAGDTIDLTTFGRSVTLSSTTSGGNTIETVVSSGGASEPFVFAGTYPDGYFTLGNDAGASAGVMLTVTGTPCYCAGTLIRTALGEVPVQALRIGDRVVTASGAIRPVKWVGCRSYDGRFVAGRDEILPVRIAAGALGDGLPRRDLMVSPLHAMFVDGVLVPAALLVNGASIVQLEQVDSIAYFHVELETHDIILAEGAPSETFVDCDSRMMFQNAAEFSRLYPDDAGRPWAFCAERVEDGERLASVRRRLASLAGLAADHAADAAEHGSLDGRVDVVDPRTVSGWAFDATRPHTPVHLALRIDGVDVATTVANGFRADLRSAGKGAGRCAFAFSLPAGLSADIDHVLEIRRLGDDALLAVCELSADPVTPGVLDGRIDHCNAVTVEGWACDAGNPGRPVRLEILAGARVVGQTLANRARPDLAEAGKGDCGFVFAFDVGAAVDPRAIRVRRAVDRAEIGAPAIRRVA